MKRTLAVVLGVVLGVAAAGPMSFAQEEEEGWPRELETTVGRIIMYQPQLETFTGDSLKARAAVSVTPTGKSEPVFGTVWIEGRCLTDRDTREVTLTSVKVPQIRFPDAKKEDEQRLATFFEGQIPKWDVTMSLDRLLAMLDLAERERVASEGFNNDPPKIVVLNTPTVLVSIDGEPRMQKIEKTSYEHVANTAFVIIHDPKSKNYYLSAGADTWYAAKAVEGPWSVTKSVPKEIAALVKEEEPEEPPEGADEGPTTPPAILVSTVPTELIVTDGKPEYSPMPGGELLYVKNTESDILMEVTSQRHFVRWSHVNDATFRRSSEPGFGRRRDAASTRATKATQARGLLGDSAAALRGRDVRGCRGGGRLFDEDDPAVHVEDGGPAREISRALPAAVVRG